MNESMNGRTNEPTNEQTNEWMKEWVIDWINEWMSEWTNERTDKWNNEWMTCDYISEIQVINTWIGKSQIIHKKHGNQIKKLTKQGINCQSVHSVGMSVVMLVCHSIRPLVKQAIQSLD